MEPWKEEEPPPGAIGFSHKGMMKSPANKMVDPVYTTREGNRSKCSICIALGLPGNHPT